MPRDMQLRMRFSDDAIADSIREMFACTLDQWVEDYVGVINAVPDDALAFERACGEAAVRGFAQWVRSTINEAGEA
jgi:hypothetical protein